MIDLSKKLGLLLVENRKTGVENALKAHGAVMEKFELKGLNKTDLRAVITDRLNLIRKVPTGYRLTYTYFVFDTLFIFSFLLISLVCSRSLAWTELQFPKLITPVQIRAGASASRGKIC